jgi:hypothetical protein
VYLVDVEMQVFLFFRMSRRKWGCKFSGRGGGGPNGMSCRCGDHVRKEPVSYSVNYKESVL